LVDDWWMRYTNHSMQYVRTNWLPLLVILVGFGASLALAFAPLNFLLANTVPDDSFYYFQIARNIVHGLGSTFDGVNLTNGYHPLWMVLLLPIYQFFSTGAVLDVAPIHAALALSAVINAALGLVLIAIVSRYTSKTWIKALALACWFFNPFNAYAMSDGLETALSLFFIALFFLVALRYGERSSYRRLLMVGIFGGLMMLARLDNVFYFVMFLAWLLYSGGLASIRNILMVGVVASIVVLPWLIFNFLTFGMFFTSASAAYTIVNHEIIIQDNGASLFQQLKAVVYMTDYSLRQFVLPQTGAPSVFLTLFGLAIGWLVYAGGGLRRFASRSVPLELFIASGCVLVFIANASIRWSPREWYFIAFDLFLVIGVAWLVEKLRESDKLRTSVAVIIVCLVASLYYISWSKVLQDRYYTSNPLLDATLWMNENIPQGSVVGSFNAGIAGYFSTNRLINLDGLVNNRAYEAIRDRRVWQYITSEKIEYFFDNGRHVNYRMRGLLGIPDILEKLEVIHETSNGPTVYKVR